MENILVIWVSSQLIDTAQIAVKAALKRDYSIDERDLKEITNGFEFLFDDETGGHAKIEFIPEGANLGIKLSANYSWEAISLYEMIQGCFDWEDQHE